jgi:photosystem II stability/assembly factor-like uncharacterized protein
VARRHVPVLLVPVLLVLASVVAVAGCTTPSSPATHPVPDTGEPGSGHVHGVELNPSDGGLYAATHDGVFRLDAESPVRVSQHRQDTMSFAAVGPDHFLASGHPAVDEPGSAHLGLTASRDGGRTWGSVALAGRADFHALSASGATVYGFDGVTTAVMRSDDAGQHWQRGAPMVVSDLDVDPDNPMRVVTATRAGLMESLDGGIAFTALAAQPPRKLALIDHVPYVGDSDRHRALIGVDAAGTVVSLDADGWQDSGSLPGPPTAFTVIAPDRYAAATGSQVFVSEDAGRTWVLVARLNE